MKKLLVLFLVLSMLFAIAACGSEITTRNENGAEATENEEPEDAVKNEEAADADETENVKDTTENEEAAFKEIVAVDNDECMIKITEIDPDNMWGFTLKAQLENKSTEKTYMFSVDSAAINGVQADPLFAAEVAAGKRSNEEISFADDVLKQNGIGEYTDVELTFRVYDSNDWAAEAVAEETIHIYPYGEDKAVKFVREAQDTDNVIIDNEYVTVIVTGYGNDIWGYNVNMFLLNKTDKTVMFSADEVSVNGFMADPLYAATVSAGKCAFSSISWLDSTFEENGISEVENIEFTFRAYDSDDWSGDDFANEVISLNP